MFSQTFYFICQTLLSEISGAGWVQVGRIDRKEIIEEEVQALFNMIDTDKVGFLTKKVKICFA